MTKNRLVHLIKDGGQGTVERTKAILKKMTARDDKRRPNYFKPPEVKKQLRPKPRPTRIQMSVLVAMRDGAEIAYRREPQGRRMKEKYWLSFKYYPQVKRPTVEVLLREGWIRYEHVRLHEEHAIAPWEEGKYLITEKGEETARFWMGLL